MKLTKSTLKEFISEEIKRLKEQEDYQPDVNPIKNLADAETILIFMIKGASGTLKQELSKALDLIESARYKLDDIEPPEDVRRIP